ncbi:hypothetical protein E4O00_00955 [Treponema sp. OMZ 788]|uniref:hypothetical protein n=1 Tax=Treponema sp. OMZ 788 TaxID=2563664 RepID=UPI0020A39AD9|nr:hypothetical protein [Treponema sp. OMZ 788]UTC64830.1 hypothetical protein E4O00_00955 [Treponema sp. OMZ 788]
MKKIALNSFVKILFLVYSLNFLIAEDSSKSKNIKADPDNPDCIYKKAMLGDCLIHMSKITSPLKGSAPVVEMLFKSDFKWVACAPHDGWGKEGKTYKYIETEVPGTIIFFNITNKINDVVYYKIDGTHPFDLPMYDEPREAKMLQRFIFFKFTAYAAKDMIFENALNNLIFALDTHTKLLYAYGMPSDYKKIIGNNYIPQKWLPYETHPNTADSNLKFYEYDPIGFVSLEKLHSFWDVKTNVQLYDWWIESVGAGSTMKTVKEKRFMPRLSDDAIEDWTIRDASKPVRSPYRKF